MEKTTVLLLEQLSNMDETKRLENYIKIFEYIFSTSDSKHRELIYSEFNRIYNEIKKQNKV